MGKRTFEDPTIAAFIQTVNPDIRITPHRREDGKVVFDAEGDGIDEALEALYKNAVVSAIDFIKNLKSFRASIFTLK